MLCPCLGEPTIVGSTVYCCPCSRMCTQHVAERNGTINAIADFH